MMQTIGARFNEGTKMNRIEGCNSKSNSFREKSTLGPTRELLIVFGNSKNAKG